MKIERKDLDTLNSSVTITLDPEDYQSSFLDELKKYKSKAHMKGFRKGKTPMNVLKKMYGQSVLAEVVMERVNKELSSYIGDEKLDLLGQPIPSEDQQRYDFDPNNLEEISFTFDLGLSPEFEINGIEDTYILHDVTIPEEIVEEELSLARKRMGEQIEEENDIEEHDILTITAVELEGEQPKAGGWETDFTIMTDQIGEEGLKEKVLKGKKGIEIDFDIYKIEKDKDEKHVKKYLLNLDDDEEKEIGNMFRGIVQKVQRIKPAEMNEEFFSKYFGNDEVKTEEEAKDKVRKEIEKYYEQQAKMVMNREVMEALMEKNDLKTPDNFLKRWLSTTNENVSPEDIEKDFESFQKNLQWTLIKNKLSKKYDVTVDPEDVRNEMRNKVLSYMQGYPMDENSLNDMVNRLLSNNEQVNKVYEEIQAVKIFEKLEGDLTLQKKEITLEKFKEVVKTLNESQAQ
jgi:trigger factor